MGQISSTSSQTTWEFRPYRATPWWLDVLEERSQLAICAVFRHRLASDQNSS